MTYLQHHADRAVARHMLAIGALVVAVAVIVFLGSQFLAAADQLSATIAGAGQ